VKRSEVLALKDAVIVGLSVSGLVREGAGSAETLSSFSGGGSTYQHPHHFRFALNSMTGAMSLILSASYGEPVRRCIVATMTTLTISIEDITIILELLSNAGCRC